LQPTDDVWVTVIAADPNFPKTDPADPGSLRHGSFRKAGPVERLTSLTIAIPDLAYSASG
jgi:hypothetical protein